MNARPALTAIAALAITLATNTAHAGLTYDSSGDLSIGTVQNDDLGVIAYDRADLASHVSVTVVNGNKNRIDIDLGGILSQLGETSLLGVRLVDTGENSYSGNGSAGADIDLLTFTGLDEAIDLSWWYAGPNATHTNEDFSMLGVRAAYIDAQASVHEWHAPYHISLGYQGALGVDLSAAQGILNGLPPNGSGALGPMLHINEAGFGESFEIFLATGGAVPAPGALALLGLAGLVGPKRRRRR